MATTRVIHVIDRVLEPPSIVKMLEITDQYTSSYDVSTLLQFFVSSGLDLGNLAESMGVEDGLELTLLAPISQNFELALSEDWEQRLQIPIWSRHARDLVTNLISDVRLTPFDLSIMTEDSDTVLETIGGATYSLQSDERIDMGYFLGTAGCIDG